ncbi:Uncharacterized protein PBTT_07492 [Plasmodiophora brassicae]
MKAFVVAMMAIGAVAAGSAPSDCDLGTCLSVDCKSSDCFASSNWPTDSSQKVSPGICSAFTSCMDAKPAGCYFGATAAMSYEQWCGKTVPSQRCHTFPDGHLDSYNTLSCYKSTGTTSAATAPASGPLSLVLWTLTCIAVLVVPLNQP